VDIASGAQSLSAAAGEQLTLSTNGEVAVLSIEVDDPVFAWAVDLAPAYDIENRTLLDFLKWVSRETGKELVFADDELRMAAMGTVLHGSVSDFTPTDATAAVLATTGFHYRIEDRQIVIHH